MPHPAIDDPTKATTEDAEILRLARAFFLQSSSDESTLRKNMRADKKFAAGDHWPERVRKQREADGRPCLTIDRLTPQIKQVTNQQRAMRPSIQVNPVAGGADPETAEVLQGMCRHIETQSDADDAYDQAGRDQAEIGRGWIRVLTDYVDDKSFDQEIKIARVRNPFTVYPDTSAQRRDYSDGMRLLIVKDLTIADFTATYPKAQPVGIAEFSSIGDDVKDWITEETIRVAEFWRVVVTRSTLTVGERSREVESRAVVCDILNGIEVLEHYDWPGKYIPLVPVLGEEIDIEGVVDLRGMVRRAKDPQQMFNVWKSATTEMIALAPKAPYLVAEGQLDPYLKQWKQANVRNFPFLTYKPTTLGGQAVAPPQRQVAEPPIQALMVSSAAAEADLRAATGFFDVDEKNTREQSGKALLVRQKQGEHGNSDFTDGLARGVRHVGRILVDLIPKIYDVPRVMRITGKDGQPKMVMVHAGNAPDPAAGLPPGVAGVYDIGTGTYDVVVSSGPSPGTARQDFVEQMAQVFQSQPQLFQYVGDLFFENMDIPNAKPIADRLKKLLPPALQDDGQGPMSPEAAKAQIAQLGQQVAQMGGALQQANQAIQGKQLELQAQKEIEGAKIQSQQAIKAAELQSKESIAKMQADVDLAKAHLDSQLAQLKLQADQAKAAMQANQADQAQASAQAHASELADKQAAERAVMASQA